MASNKTPNLGLDIWQPDDFFKRAEVNNNFTKIDNKFAETAQNASQKADKTYTDNQLTLKRDKVTPIIMSDLHTDVKTAMTGGSVPVVGINSTGTENIKPQSVTAEKTTFLIASPNLFDKTKITANYYIDPSNGNAVSAATGDISDYIAILPSTYYVKNVKGHVAFYSSNKVYISGINETTALAGVSFQSPANAAYIRFSIKKSEGFSADTTQFEKGQTTTAYQPYDFSTINPEKLDIKKGLVFSPKDTDFLTPSRNLFDVSKSILNKYVDPNTGNLVDATSNDSSDYIPVLPSTSYVKNVKGNVAFYTSGKVYISGVNETTALANVSFQTPSNAAYVRFSIKKSEGFSSATAQFEKGTAPTAYISASVYSIDKTKVELPSSANKYAGKKMNFLGDSITAAGKYQSIIQAALGLSVVRNYGVGGTTLVGNGTNGFVDRYTGMDDDADVIYVQGGTNDFSQDITLTNFKASLVTLIEGLCQKYHGKTIIFATLPPRYIKYLGANNAGFTTLDYANTTKEICAQYSIPVVDLHNESSINRFNMDLYMPDFVHPNDAGYKLLTNLIVSKLNQI